VAAQRREQRCRRKQPPSHCSAIDNPDYDESRQNEYPIGNLGTRYRCFPAKPFHGLPPSLDRPAFNTPTISPISQKKPLGLRYRCRYGLAILATLRRKSRQGLPRRLVPLHLRRGTVSSGARTQPLLALIWTHATFNVAGGCVASVSGQRSPIPYDM
jgi:hypothetical protein